MKIENFIIPVAAAGIAVYLFYPLISKKEADVILVSAEKEKDEPEEKTALINVEPTDSLPINGESEDKPIVKKNNRGYIIASALGTSAIAGSIVILGGYVLQRGYGGPKRIPLVNAVPIDQLYYDI